jgi:hypothetical protein
MKAEQKLARAFQALAEQGATMDSTASQILGIVKGARALNEERFDRMVEAAYTAAGWNPTPGRPKAGEEPKGAVPDTVRTYVTIVRRALRLRLKVGRYETFTALRTALEKKARPKPARAGKKNGHANGAAIAHLPQAVREDFVGIAIEKPREANGALFHDLSATFIRLPEKQRSEMGRKLNALLHEYLPMIGVKSFVAERAKRLERKAA